MTRREELIQLAARVEAAFREGWNAGWERGSAEASAYDWGTRCFGQPTQDEAWEDSVAAAALRAMAEDTPDA